MILLFLLLFPFTAPGAPNVSKINKVVNYLERTKTNCEYAMFIDMSIPSNEKRLFLVQLDSNKIIYSAFVAHGIGSGKGVQLTKFSDKKGSRCTAPGLYKIGRIYKGKNGDSFEMEGLEKTNANALKRNIVIHSAWYADEEFIKKEGRCGNSWGCPAVSEESLEKLKPYLEQNILVYIYM